jgi:hypothetical protein
MKTHEVAQLCAAPVVVVNSSSLCLRLDGEAGGDTVRRVLVLEQVEAAALAPRVVALQVEI